MRTTFLRTIVLASIVTLTGCAGYDPPGTTYIRTDGQAISPDQVAADRKACSDADKPQRCMLEKGYFLVQGEQATEKQQTLAEIAQKNKEEQEAVIAAENARQDALRREAARKKRKKKAPVQAKPANSQSSAARIQPAANAQGSPWPSSQPQR
jgi:hypothetical protein